jgi:hypothetical protein
MKRRVVIVFLLVLNGVGWTFIWFLFISCLNPPNPPLGVVFTILCPSLLIFSLPIMLILIDYFLIKKLIKHEQLFFSQNMNLI